MKCLILAVICRTIGAPDWVVWLAGICAALGLLVTVGALLELAIAFYHALTDSN